MIEMMWLQSHVRQLLQAEWDLCRVEVDCDGDVPFQSGTAACWVNVTACGDELFVRVFAHAAHSVRRSAKLLAEINDVNNRSRTAGIRWSNGFVVVEQTLCAHGVNQKSLAQACSDVGSVADDLGLMITAMFGGETPFPYQPAEGQTEDEAA